MVKYPMATFMKTHGPPISDNISYPTDDVLINILSRLLVKSLSRFNCVSKAWNSLISNPSFQGILSTPMSGLFYTTRCYKIPSAERFQWKFITDKTRPNYKTSAIDIDDLSFFPHHHKFYIIDCCSGLLLGLAHQGINSTPVYYIINLATKKWAALPMPHKERHHTTHMLAFDPCVSPHYTLICSGIFPGVDIFSSKTGMWIQYKVPQELVPQPWRQSTGSQAILFNCTLHMLSGGDSIVGFDFDEECFRLIPLPVLRPMDARECRKRSLGVSGGYLYYANHDGFLLQIWMLKDYDELKWVLKHETTIDSSAEKYPRAICSSDLYKNFYKHFLMYYIIPKGSHLPFWLNVKYLNVEQILDDRIIVEAEISSRRYYLSEFSVFAFHSDLEVVFLGMGDTMFSYHLCSMKLEEVWVSKLKYSRLHLGNVYPFSPCLADFYG